MKDNRDNSNNKGNVDNSDRDRDNSGNKEENIADIICDTQEEMTNHGEEDMLLKDAENKEINLEIFEDTPESDYEIDLPLERKGKRSSDEKAKAPKSIVKEICEWLALVVIAFLIASVIQSELFALTEVNMSSMRDTLEPGDRLIMNKLAYVAGEPQKGDIIIFLRDEQINGVLGRVDIYVSDIMKKLNGEFRRNRLIKRVIGLPGDEIEIVGNVLYINGVQQTDEEYARTDPYKQMVLNGNLEKLIVPEGKLFVMGDNRGESLDSRSFGVIDRSWVEGKAVFRILPLDKAGSVDGR